LALLFGGHRLRLDPRTVAACPQLGDHVRRTVVIGIRPEHVRAARRASDPADSSLLVRVDRTEQRGGDTFVAFAIDAPVRLRPLEDPVSMAPTEDAPPGNAQAWLATVEDESVEPGDVV